MKHIVSIDDYCERDIKPVALIDRYIELVKADVKKFLIDRDDLADCGCPACLETDSLSAFTKFGLKYVECSVCGSLRISPRPTDEALQKYFQNSEARKFWLDKIYQSTESSRRNIITKPRIEWISDSTMEHCPKASHIADFKTNQPAVLNELITLNRFNLKSLINPCLPFQTPKPEGFQIENFSSNIKSESIDVVTLFEAADRTSDVETVFKEIGRILKKDGLCFMTDILSSGFDVMVLWNNAKNIFPPDRLNLFTNKGLQILFERHGFKCLEFSTPGNLDLAIIESAMKENPDLEMSRFIRYMLDSKDENVKKDFQAFLQMHLMSSYARILIQKK